jgi:hypothetical protein
VPGLDDRDMSLPEQERLAAREQHAQLLLLPFNTVHLGQFALGYEALAVLGVGSMRRLKCTCCESESKHTHLMNVGCDDTQCFPTAEAKGVWCSYMPDQHSRAFFSAMLCRISLFCHCTPAGCVHLLAALGVRTTLEEVQVRGAGCNIVRLA